MKYKHHIILAVIFIIAGTPVAANAAQDTTPPPTPGGFILTQRSGANLRFGWQWTMDNGSYVPKYQLSYADKVVIVDHYYPSHDQNVADLNLQPGNSYTFELRAIDHAGNRSVTPARFVLETTPPAVATNLQLVSTRGGQPDIIKFTAAADNSGTIGNYEVFLNGESLGTTGNGHTQFSFFDQINYIACIDPPTGPATVQLRAIDSSFNQSQQLSLPLTVVFP
jgi:hypothetical protein